MKEDKEPTVWGEVDIEEVKQMIRDRKRHKKYEAKRQTLAKDERIQKLSEASDWLDIYKDESLAKYGLTHYSSMRAVYDDLQTVKEREENAFRRIVTYAILQGRARV